MKKNKKKEKKKITKYKGYILKETDYGVIVYNKKGFHIETCENKKIAKQKIDTIKNKYKQYEEFI